MPPQHPPGGQPAHGRHPASEEKRAVIVISDGTGMPAALDRARTRVNRMPGVRAVDVEHDNEAGEGFLRAVDRRKRGEVEAVVLPSPKHLPPWIVFAEGDPRRPPKPRS